MTGAYTLRGFIARTLLWLPACFAAWYFAAPYHAEVVGGVARALVNAIEHGIIGSLERTGSTLVFVTTVGIPAGTGQVGLVAVEVNPLLYTYGLALFLALMLAARAKWWQLAAGVAILLPFQAWGIAFDVLSQLAITLGPEVAARAGITGWRVEAIALAYQAGTLLFPALAPVVTWAVFGGEVIRQAMRASRAAPEPAAEDRSVRHRTDGSGSAA
jgi:hypothetical protein